MTIGWKRRQRETAKSPNPRSHVVCRPRVVDHVEAPERQTRWELVAEFGITPGRVIEIASAIGRGGVHVNRITLSAGGIR